MTTRIHVADADRDQVPTSFPATHHHLCSQSFTTYSVRRFSIITLIVGGASLVDVS